MKKDFRTSAKSYKLNNKEELVYIRSFKEKDKLTKKLIKKIALQVPAESELGGGLPWVLPSCPCRGFKLFLNFRGGGRDRNL